MACADALVAPRPIEPAIAKPAIESLLTIAVILQLLCCLLRPREKPTARMVVPGSDQVLDRSFCCDQRAHRDAKQPNQRRHAGSIARHQEVTQQPAGRRQESGRNPEGPNSLGFVLQGVTT
jgi:hypothetical protein